jgi:uncharacterized protein
MNLLYTMAIESFVPMLESLSAILDKGNDYTKSAYLDLPAARLAPDMFTLAEQVQQACFYAENGVARLIGRDQVNIPGAGTTLADLKAQIAAALNAVRGASVAEFDGAETRDCSIELPNDMVIEMDGVRFLRSWILPHFYFHVVTAYDILRHSGVSIGKMDYLSQAGRFIRPKAA